MTFECCKKCVVNGCCSCQSDNNYASCSDVFQELIKKIDKLEKKLDIALKAFQRISHVNQLPTRAEMLGIIITAEEQIESVK